MTQLSDLWFRTTEATQQAEQAYHSLVERYDEYIEVTHARRVSRRRFRTLTDRIQRTGAPYGAHTIVYRPSGSILLVRHEGVDMWVLPGGEVGPEESFLDAAKRELAEEAGVAARYDGLGIVARIDLDCDAYSTWGVMPIFSARAEDTETAVNDPDGEISAARWFDELPQDTRDRDDLELWLDSRFG